MKTNTRNVFVGVILMIVMLLGISMLTACNDVSLDKLQNEYGIVIDGGGFEEGSTLVSNEIAVSTEEATEVLAAIADQNYDKDGKERQKLRNKMRWMKDPAEMQPIREQIFAISDKLKPLRKEYAMCKDIYDRSDDIEKTVEHIEFPQLVEQERQKAALKRTGAKRDKNQVIKLLT